MITLAYAVALFIIPALALAAASTRYDLDARECPDVRLDTEIDREGLAHLERSLHRLVTDRVTDSETTGHTYATVEDRDTGSRIARVVSSAARAWYDLTSDPVVLALEILRQECAIAWDWQPRERGWYDLQVAV